MNHTEYMRGPLARSRAKTALKIRERFESIKPYLLAILLVALFLGASYGDHQALTAGLIN